MKKHALFLFCTKEWCFAIANLLISLKKYHLHQDIDVIIFHNGLIDSDVLLLKQIYNNINFHLYNDDIFIRSSGIKLDEYVGSKTSSRYTSIIFSKFEIFDFFNMYSKILCLDADSLFLGDVDIIYKNNNNLMNESFTSLKKQLGFDPAIYGVDGEFKGWGAGIMYFTDKYNYTDVKKMCYNIARENFNKLLYPEQSIISLVLCNKKIPIDVVPRSIAKECMDITDNDSILIMGKGIHKFWTDTVVYHTYPEWGINHKQWVSLGGTAGITENCQIYKKYIISNFSRKALQETLFYNNFWFNFYEKIKFNIPYLLRVKLLGVKNYIQFHIDKVDKSIHYELIYNFSNKCMTCALHAEDIKNYNIDITDENVNLMNNFSKFKYQYEEYKNTKSIYCVVKENDASECIKELFENTIQYFKSAQCFDDIQSC